MEIVAYGKTYDSAADALIREITHFIWINRSGVHVIKDMVGNFYLRIEVEPHQIETIPMDVTDRNGSVYMSLILDI